MELNIFENKLQFLDKTFIKTKRICQQANTRNITFCNTNIKILNQLIPTIYKQEDTLKTLINHRREKRALLNVVGTLFKSVFGTLDENDAEYYNEAINKVKENENNLINLLKQQVQVVKTTITNFNNTITSLNNNKIIFNENFSKLSKYIGEINQKYFLLDLSQTLEEQFSLLNLMLTELQNEYSAIINSILFSRSNVLHPFVITPYQLLNELKSTISYIPSSASYALPLEIKNAYKLYELVELSVYFNDNRIIYVISNPLINNKQFFLYKLAPLPIINESNMLFILPSINFIALSEDKNEYTILKNRDNCKTLQEILICPLGEPFYNTHTRPICETQLLFVNTHIPNECDTRILNNKAEIWHKLETGNNWLYVLPKPTDVTVSCLTFPLTNMILNDTGILSIRSNCKLFTSATTLLSESSNLESTYKVIIPNFEIKLEDCCEEDKKDKTHNLTLSPMNAINLDKDSLNIASHKLNQINKLADNLAKTNSDTISNIISSSYFVYFICTIGKVILLFVLYRLYKKCLRPLCNRSNDKCRRITNVLTLNICKNSEKTDVNLELGDNPSNSMSEDTEGTSLRRSIRIAQLKDKI